MWFFETLKSATRDVWSGVKMHGTQTADTFNAPQHAKFFVKMFVTHSQEMATTLAVWLRVKSRSFIIMKWTRSKFSWPLPIPGLKLWIIKSLECHFSKFWKNTSALVNLKINHTIGVMKDWIQCMPSFVVVALVLLGRVTNFSAYHISNKTKTNTDNSFDWN